MIIVSNKRVVCENYISMAVNRITGGSYCAFFISSNKKCVCVNYNSMAVNHITGVLPNCITINSQLVY